MRIPKLIVRQHIIFLITSLSELLHGDVATLLYPKQPSEDILIPVELWDVQGRVIHGGSSEKYYIPRYLVGLISSQFPSCSPANHHHFTFDLGNPGITTLLDPACRGCYDGITNGNDNFCPTQVPSCNVSNTSTSDVCWPSRPHEFLPKSCFEYLSDNTTDCFSYGDKVVDAGTLYYNKVCMMCFDSGNHSRYFIPSKAQDLVILSVYPTTKKVHKVVYKLPSPFSFGALIRTVPLQDRIWSNVGIGYHSSFMNQTRLTSIQFSLSQQRVNTLAGELSNNLTKRLYETEISFIRFNPDPQRYINSLATQRYRTPHHRIHSLDGFAIDVISSFIFSKRFFKTSFDFIMDTGNGGICIADKFLKAHLADTTGGEWRPCDKKYNHLASSHTTNLTSEQLIIPYLSPSIAPDLQVIFTPGIRIIMKGYMWLISHYGHTIFVTCDLNVLGLPFMASGVELVFDDANKMLYIMGDNVHINGNTANK